MPDVTSLYDEDFFLWSKEQAEALRAAARGASNRPIDWQNVAEEIGDLGKSERRELASRVSVIIEHLAKLEYSHARNPRKGWHQTVRRERAEIDRILDDSPSLRREVPLLVVKEARRAIEIVIAELGNRGDLRPRSPGLSAKVSGTLCAYTPEQILGDWFPPEPARGGE